MKKFEQLSETEVKINDDVYRMVQKELEHEKESHEYICYSKAESDLYVKDAVNLAKRILEACKDE